MVPSTQLVLRLCHPDDRARLRLHLDDLARESTALPLEYRIVLPKGGEVRYLRSTVAAFDEDRRAALLIVGSVQDVTAEHLAEREIASRFAVTSALASWTSFEEGMEGLLRAACGGYRRASRHGLAARPRRPGRKGLLERGPCDHARVRDGHAEPHLPRGRELPGRVWESGTPSVS